MTDQRADHEAQTPDQRRDKRISALEEALENQEYTIREQEKDIVTLKLQVQALQSALQSKQ